MRHNKILGAAIVAALSIGGGTAPAADMKLSKIGATAVTDVPTIARELFPADTPTAIPALPQGGTFETTYTMSTLTADIAAPFTVTYTLTGGEWTTDKPQATDFVVDNKSGFPVIFMSESSNSIQFKVDADSTNKLADGSTPTLVLGGFQVDVDKATFASAGQEVALTISLSGSVDDSQTATLVKSGTGASCKLNAGNDNDVKIDVGADGKKFTGSVTTKDTAAILGTVAIDYSSPQLKDYTLLNDWGFGGADGIKSGSFSITGGPFDASLGSNMVFVDINNNNCAYDAGDLAASPVTSTTAKWNSLTKAQMDSIRDGGTKNICMTVNGTTQINAQDNAPTGEGKLSYEHRTDTIDCSGTLRLLKRNGALCTLYNVPDEDALDQPFIRITNRSGGNGSFLRGSLRKPDGTYVFTNQDLLATTGTATFKNNATVVVTPTHLQTLATQSGYNPETDRWGRGIMTITSDLSKMEVFGLLRQGTALTNFSQVASGENCGN